MQRVLRFLLVWLLVAAMPLKGVAAVAMLACGPAHGTQAVHAGHAGQGHAAHDHAAHHPAATHGEAAPDHADQDGADASFAHKCSACASCGAGAALPADAPRLLPCAAAPEAFRSPPLSLVRFVTDGPDRPPRTPLA